MIKNSLKQIFKPRIIVRILTLVFLFLALSVFVAFFYLTPLRSKVEGSVYDLKMLSQVNRKINRVDFFELQHSLAQKISAEEVVRLLSRFMKLKPKHIVLALPNRFWKKIENKKLLIDFASQHASKVTLGRPQEFFEPTEKNLSTSKKSLYEDSQVFLQSKSSFYFYDSLRPFRRQVVRTFPLLIPSGASLLPHLSLIVAKKILPEASWPALEDFIQSQLVKFKRNSEIKFFRFFDAFAADGPSFLLNYPNIRRLQSHRTSIGDETPLKNPSQLENKVLVIGTSSFVPRGKGEAEGTHTNTPWQSDHTKVSAEKSFPIHYLIGISIENLVSGSYLKQPPQWANFLQSLLFFILGLLSWYTTTPRKALIFLAYSILALIGFHLLLMHFFYLHLPLADVIAASLIANTGGAFRYSYWSSRLRELQKIQLEEKSKIDSIQGNFLSRFSGRLASLNLGVLSKLESIADLPTQSTMQKMIFRLGESSREFDEYLRGISQVANIANTQKPKKSAVKILPCIEETLIQLNLNEKDQIERVEIRVEEGLAAFSDTLLLKAILYNLLSNAFKYSNERVIISAFTLDKDILRIKIQDDGPGIPLAYQGKVFEKFYRVKNDQVYKIKGNGLGLYLTKYFAELLRARLSLASEEGHGCTFSLDLKLFMPEKAGTLKR